MGFLERDRAEDSKQQKMDDVLAISYLVFILVCFQRKIKNILNQNLNARFMFMMQKA